MSAIDADSQFTEETITDVEPGDDDHFTVHFGSSAFCPRNPRSLPLPAVGDTARLYGRGFGYEVRGFAVDQRVYFYETAADHEARTRHEIEQKRASQAKAFDDTRVAYDEKVDALPEAFRHRIRRFLLVKPGWGGEFGGYELFVCQEAVRIAEGLKTEEAIRSFAASDIEEQRRRLPGLGFAEHSGNTFGAACRLAIAFVVEPELLPKHHGALCALVGCTDYGCWAAYEANSGEAT